jgi:hypothetical protein
MAIRIVDVHAHPPTKEFLIDSGGQYIAAAARLFRQAVEPKSFEEMLAEYDACGIERILLLAWNNQSVSGLPPVSNEFIAEVVEKHPGRFFGAAMVDPPTGEQAPTQLDHAIRNLHLAALKLHPQAQNFLPNDRRAYPLYEKCVELRVPVIFHSGTTNWGGGLPGGGGVKLAPSNPMYIDDVAADFPELKILMAHPGWPWQDEQLAIIQHKENVHLDLSGWSPKYLQPILLTYMSKLIPDKVMFGTDYPMLKPARWLKEFDELNLPDDTRRRILSENALRFFRL